MILVNPPSGKSNIPKETNSKEIKFSDNEDSYWHNLTEGELVDIDLYTGCAIGEFDYVKTFIQNAKTTYDTNIINKCNKSGWTPLMYVCYVGNDEITKLLIREGADVFFEQDKNGRTPLMLAASSGNVSLVKRLIENNARVNHVDKNGQTALFYAAEHGQTSVVKYLLRVDADVLIRQNGTGYTPFMEAARQGHEGVFSAFLDYGIDLDLKCNDGKTARGLAENCESHVILNMIDNYSLKFPSLRYEADLSDFGMEEIRQPIQKVNEWLNDHNRDHSFDVISTNKVVEKQSHAIAIKSNYKSYSAEESFGKSVGDSTIVDSERTPVGTPVDSILQQYMAHDMAQTRARYEFPTLEVFLKDLGLEKHLKLLEDESIDFSVLLDLTEEDFKELDMKFGPRKKIRTAIQDWKKEIGWSQDGNFTFVPAIDNLKRKLADAYSSLQDVSADLAREKEARGLLEAEQMEGRARISHTYFIAEKVVRACKELQSTNKTLKKHIETLKTVANENKKEDLKSRLKELHNQMSEDISNTDNITETILRRVQKVLCDDVTEFSSSSDSPESSCTSYGTGGSIC